MDKCHKLCGGCPLRELDFAPYKEQKEASFIKILSQIKQENIPIGAPFFVCDGSRRRCSFTFIYRKGSLIFGFNQRQSHNIYDITSCHLLTPRINNNIVNIRQILNKICSYGQVKKGDVWVLDADQGLDVVLEFEQEPGLNERMDIFEFGQEFSDIIRISHRSKAASYAQALIEKVKPTINICGYDILVKATDFLQPTQMSQNFLIDTLKRYVGSSSGKFMDLFCGCGTFSYAFANQKNIKIHSVDSSEDLLSNFTNSIKRNQIHNINVFNKNLFKEAPDEDDLKDVSVVVIDPPRAGAKSVVNGIYNSIYKPHKIIAVSCNPHTFVNDANVLINAGYTISEVIMVDQFTYSHHFELIACFEQK